MPHGFEYVVRPFQSPGSLGNIVIPGTPERTQDKAHITWGGVGTMPSTKIINPDVVVKTKEEVIDEKDRDSEVQRIVGNDGESYVDVARAKQVRFDSTETRVADAGQTFYSAGPTLSEALSDYLESFSSVAQATSATMERGKFTMNLKNQ